MDEKIGADRELPYRAENESLKEARKKVEKTLIEGDIRRLLELRREVEQLRNRKEKIRSENLIYFFNREREDLGLPPNPLQAQILCAWGEPKQVMMAEKGMSTPEMIERERAKRALYKVFAMTGANRIGKTTISTILALCVVFGEWPWTCADMVPGTGKKLGFGHRLPRKIRYIGQDWEKHIAQVVIPEIRKWWPKNREVQTRKNNMGVDAFWTDVLTGSTLEVMSNKQESDLHEGWSGDFVIYDEPPRREIRVANARGLVDRLGREFFGMTLLKEAWVDREVLKALDSEGNPDSSVFCVHGDIYVNEGFGITREGIEQFSKVLNAEERDARLKGIPSYMSGLVLPEFRREKHMVRRPQKLPLDWIVDVHIDFHPSKPWAVLFKAVDSRGFHYIIDEYMAHGSWKSVGEEIVRRLKSWKLRVNAVLIDPLTKGDPNSDLHEESVFDKMRGLFHTYGYRLSPASKDKEGGIHILRDLLMTENGMPALFVFDNCKRLVYEIEGWMYDEQGRPLKKDDDMVEGLYRLCLLNTEWVGIEEDEVPIKRARGNQWTGY